MTYVAIIRGGNFTSTTDEATCSSRIKIDVSVLLGDRSRGMRIVRNR